MNTGPISSSVPVLFEPNENAQLPSGLSTQEELKSVKGGNCTIMHIKVTNNTDHDITLYGRTVLGRLQLVRSVTPLEVKFKETEQSNDTDDPMNQSLRGNDRSESPDIRPEINFPPVDLTGLTADQQVQAKQLLFEERDSFAVDDDDVGCIPELQMDLTLTSDQPVQKNYISIPVPGS